MDSGAIDYSWNFSRIVVAIIYLKRGIYTWIWHFGLSWCLSSFCSFFPVFFSSSETSMFSLNSIHLEKMHRDGNPRFDLIQRMLSEPRRLIVTILIGNEFVNVAASVLSAAMVVEVMGADSKLVNILRDNRANS